MLEPFDNVIITADPCGCFAYEDGEAIEIEPAEIPEPIPGWTEEDEALYREVRADLGLVPEA